MAVCLHALQCACVCVFFFWGGGGGEGAVLEGVLSLKQKRG